MKILSYTATYVGSGHQAGSEVTLHDSMVALKRSGHQVMALASRPFKDGSGSYVIDGVPVQAFGSKQDPDLYFPKFDLVLTQFECAQRAWYIGMKHNIKTIQMVHNNTEYATNLATRYNDALVYNAHHVAESIRKEMPKDNRPNMVFHPLVDPKRYEVSSSREYITLVNLSDGTEPFYNKGYETFYYLAEKFPDERFLGVKGAYGEQVVRDLPNVTVVEHTSNILDIYRKSKIVLMPSQIESWGRVAIEAACSGIPSLTSTTPGLLESGIGYINTDFGAQSKWETALGKLLSDYDYASYVAKEKSRSLYMSALEEQRQFLQFVEEVV